MIALLTVLVIEGSMAAAVVARFRELSWYRRNRLLTRYQHVEMCVISILIQPILKAMVHRNQTKLRLIYLAFLFPAAIAALATTEASTTALLGIALCCFAIGVTT